jgi:hypothetical protein
MKRLRLLAGAALAAAALLASVPLAAPKRLPKTDRIWTHPQIATFGIERIAVLPIATFDGNLDAEKQVELAFGQSFRTTAHRWVPATSSRDQMRARAGGSDSLVKAVKAMLLQQDRIDSLTAQRLCGMLRCDAVLGIRVEQYERRQLEWNEAGKPSTSVRLRATLVDTLGRLAWVATGSEVGEGSYNTPGAGVTGMTASGLENKPMSAQAGAPRFVEVLVPLFQRWVEHFPAPSTPPAVAPATATTADSAR